MINSQLIKTWNVITICNLFKSFPSIADELIEKVIGDYEIYGKYPTISIIHISELKKHYYNKEDNREEFDWITSPDSQNETEKQKEYELFLKEIENINLYIDISSDNEDDENNKQVTRIIEKINSY